jgi:hypothetical protein
LQLRSKRKQRDLKIALDADSNENAGTVSFKDGWDAYGFQRLKLKNRIFPQ